MPETQNAFVKAQTKIQPNKHFVNLFRTFIQLLPNCQTMALYWPLFSNKKEIFTFKKLTLGTQNLLMCADSSIDTTTDRNRQKGKNTAYGTHQLS